MVTLSVPPWFGTLPSTLYVTGSVKYLLRYESSQLKLYADDDD